MISDKNIRIFLVDDDALFLKSLEIEFDNYSKVTIKKYSTGEKCLEHIDQQPDLIVLDFYLNSIDEKAMNGLETLDKIKAINPNIPVIMLSSQDSIDIAVDCMKHNAYDYIVKSETAFFRLQKAITSYFKQQKIEKALSWYMEKM
jgi:DNA-binding NtrC family response regulator